MTTVVAESKFKVEPWQLEDLAKLYDRHSTEQNTANWSEMGCYKTSTCLWLMEQVVKDIENPRCIIITTPSGKGTYYEAIPAILPQFTLIDITTQGVFIVIPGGRRVKAGERLADLVTVPHIVLTHYHVFAKCNKGEPKRNPDKTIVKDENGVVQMLPWTQADYLLEREWDFAIVDEAHRLKNPKTKWTKHIKKMKVPARHVMTGTGFINRPDEIWSLLNFLDRKRFSSYWRFRDTYCDVDTWSGFAKVVGVKPEKKDEFRALVREVGVRRTLDEVMPHIKQPIFVRREVELNKEQRTMFEGIKKELRALDLKGEPIHSPNVLSALNRLRQISVATPELVDDYYDEKLERRIQKIKLTEPSSKLDELMELLSELQWDDDERQQVVVFSCFKDPLELLKVRLNAANIPYIHMEEKDSDKLRYEKWFEQFPKKEHQVFMSTLQLGSESINLSCARHVVFLDRSWSPKDNQQGVGRVRRPGQEGQPVVINVEAKDTTDQRLEKTNYDKIGWFKEIFGEDDNNGNGK